MKNMWNNSKVKQNHNHKKKKKKKWKKKKGPAKPLAVGDGA